MKRLLAENGSIYVHCDWHVGHYIKIIMDEVFGRDNFRNEVIWYYPDYLQGNVTRRFPRKNDFILHYSKQEDFKFYRIKEKLDRPVKRNKVYWNKETQRMELVRDKDGKIVYEEFTEKYCDTVWQIGQTSVTRPQSAEYLPFDTQKPEELLRRIIMSASDPNDIVGDFFAGSGTTLAVAERLGRCWIGVDFSKVAIQVARNRLVNMSAKPFLVENIGNYQRHMIYLYGGRIYEMQRIVLKLYDATPRKDYPDMGIRKAEDGVTELIWVSYPDRPVTAKRVEELAKLAERLDGRGYKRLVILGWDYEYNFDQLWEARKRAIPCLLYTSPSPRD